MNNTDNDFKSNLRKNTKVFSTIDIVFALIGFFIFGWQGALGILLLGLLYGYATLIAFLPVIGVPIQWAVITFAIKPFVFNLTPIYNNRLTLTMYWFALGMGIIVQIAALIFISVKE